MNQELQSQTGRTTLEYVAFSNLYEEPSFSPIKSKGIISLGEDNALPSYVISLLDKSPDHQSAIVGKIMFSHGSGLIPPKANKKAEKMFQNGEPNIAAPNNLNEIQLKLLSDLVVHGHCALFVEWGQFTDEIVEVNYIDVTSFRIDENEQQYKLSDDWMNTRKHPITIHPRFDTNNRVGKQILYVKMPSAKPYPYGMPSYWSARHAIECVSELMAFNLNRLKNNFFVSCLINFPDIPLDEKQKENHDKIKKFFSGSKGKNVGGALALYGGANGEGVTITPFESGSGPKDYQWIEKTASQKIKSSHGVTGSLFGMGRGDDQATFTSNDDLLNEFEVYSKMVIRPFQTAVLGIWNMIGQINGIGHVWEIDPFVLFDPNSRITTATGNNGTPALDASPLALPAGDVVPGAPVAESAMNGAQIESLLSIVSLVAAGTLSKATALPLIRAAFPTISADIVQAMLDGTDAAVVPPSNPLV